MKKEITFKELKDSGYKNKTINEEIQANLILRIKAKNQFLKGLWAMKTRLFLN